MDTSQIDALAEALAAHGWLFVLVRQTEDGEQYIDLAESAEADPVASVWFDPSGEIVWGDEYEYSMQLSDPSLSAQTILYTLKDA